MYLYTGIEFDELQALAYLGLIKASTTWDPYKGAFSTHVGRCVKSEITHAVAKIYRRHEYESVSLDAPWNDEDCCLGDILPSDGVSVEDTIDRQDLLDRIYEYLPQLPSDERTAILLFFGLGGFEETHPTVIAEHLNIHKRTIYTIVNRNCAKLRKALAA